MKPALQLSVGQHLTLTPQLQHAIRLLQMSSLDLQTEIDKTLEENPLLEVQEEEAQEEAQKKEEEKDWGTTEAEAVNNEHEVDLDTTVLTQDLPVDSVWDDVYVSNVPAKRQDDEDDPHSWEVRSGTTQTLQDHLTWQMELSHFSERDLVIATSIIDSIGDDGFLTSSVEDILDSVQDEEATFDLDEVLAVLHRIQRFDPLGVGAQDVRECLLLQLTQYDSHDADVRLAKTLVSDYMMFLGNRDYNRLRRKAKLSEAELAAALKVIQSLNPRPGNQIESGQAQYVVPDVTVRKVKGRWVVELNQETLPKLRINSEYAGMVRRGDNSADNTYLRNHLQEARWFLKSIQSRNETLMKVATCIVERQQGFLEHGEEAMQPMVLHDVAEAVEMHESTISRVTTQKYMHTPRGVFELKYFFSSHVGTDDGGEFSSTAIRALIKKLIADEDGRRPLSDNKIAAHLAEKGIRVARRTVAKYREAMAIPASNERKSLVA